MDTVQSNIFGACNDLFGMGSGDLLIFSYVYPKGGSPRRNAGLIVPDVSI